MIIRSGGGLPPEKAEGIKIDIIKTVIHTSRLRKEDIHKITNKVTSLDSIGKIKSKPSENALIISFDARVTSKKEIINAIEETGYRIMNAH